MNSKERVLAALDHREPDRIPVDFSGHRSSGISAMAYAKLRKYLDLETKPIRVYDPVQQLAIVDEDVLDRFGIDVIELGRGFDDLEGTWIDWVLPDGTPCKMPSWTEPKRGKNSWDIISPKSGRVIATMPDSAIYFEQTYWPFAEKEDFDDIGGSFSESMWCTMVTPLVLWPRTLTVLKYLLMVRAGCVKVLIRLSWGYLAVICSKWESSCMGWTSFC